MGQEVKTVTFLGLKNLLRFMPSTILYSFVLEGWMRDWRVKYHRAAMQAAKFASSRAFESKRLIQAEFGMRAGVRVLLAARNSVFTAYALGRVPVTP